MHSGVYSNFFEGTLICSLHAQDETNAGMPKFAGTPPGKPAPWQNNSCGKKFADVGEPIDLPRHVATELLPDLAADSPHLHRIEESSIERDTHAPCRRLPEPEATACLCESGIELFRQLEGEQGACRLSG